MRFVLVFVVFFVWQHRSHWCRQEISDRNEEQQDTEEDQE